MKDKIAKMKEKKVFRVGDDVETTSGIIKSVVRTNIDLHLNHNNNVHKVPVNLKKSINNHINIFLGFDVDVNVSQCCDYYEITVTTDGGIKISARISLEEIYYIKIIDVDTVGKLLAKNFAFKIQEFMEKFDKLRK